MTVHPDAAVGVSTRPAYPALLPCYVVLDLETTGGNAQHDRITEVALVRVEHGHEVARWQTLVQPGVRIPPFIERLTGIRNALVAGAPPFERIAPTLMGLLDGAVLVAHNVRFDHGFLLAACARAGLTLNVRTLCSVRLSRALDPQERSHGLDALLQRTGLACTARHRAMGDVQAVLDWLTHQQQARGLPALQGAAAQLLRGSAALPPGLETPLGDLPTGPGVYLMMGDGDELLYIGKSVSVRQRVLAHFQAGLRDAHEQRLAQSVRRVKAMATAGEVGALLLEARLVKQHQPLLNRQLRRERGLCAWALQDDPRQQPLVKLLRAQEDGFADARAVYGPYRTRSQAVARLRELAQRHQLCLRALGLESGKGRCFAHQLGQCLGVCCGAEAPQAHLDRLRLALQADALRAWPYAGVVGLREHDPDTDRTDIHLFDRWCHLGTVQDPSALDDALYARHPLAFDLDTYRIALKALWGPLGPRADVLNLPRT